MGYLDLIKGQDEETYKKYAQNGIDLMFPVTINGETHRPDNGIRYHNTIKLFDGEKDNKDHIHDKAKDLDFQPPDPKEVHIEPIMLQGKGGYQMHALRMHGPHADKIKEHNSKFSGMGFQQSYEFHPHITVDKEVWDRVRRTGAKTADEAGIKFHSAELRHGNAIVQTYHPKLAASEGAKESHRDLKPCTSCGHKLDTGNAKFIGTQHWGPRHPSQDLYNCPKCDSTIAVPAHKPEKMEKGIKHAVAGMAVAAGLAGAPAKADTKEFQAPQVKLTAPVQSSIPESIKRPDMYSTDRMANTIRAVESQKGKFTNHKELQRGPDSGEHAFGQYGLTPSIIRETIHMNPEFKRHKKVMGLKGDDLRRYMEDNPNLQHDIAVKHIKRLEHHFGQDPAKIGYAWLNGITGTNQALKQKADINNHWHVKKINDAYGKEQ